MAEIKLKLRFDYPGQVKSGKLFGSKNPEQQADDTRQHKVAMMRNVPIQGIRIEDIDMSQDIYSLIDDITGKKVAYAPVMITFFADSIEDAIKFVIKEEFRTVEILEPEELQLTKSDLEKLLFRVSMELNEYRDHLLRKIDNWK
ncbi:MAG: hypothetical protein VB084_15365 [Syntrophomonadaceae bacterium]|nr:hypothetical protein [Syntrophomonadaceae bacterium]